MNFKRAVDELDGRRVVLFGGASFIDSLYPHVAFRPVSDIRLLVSPADLDGLAGWLGRAEFKPEKEMPGDTFAGERLLSDGRTSIYLHASLSGSPALDAAMIARATANRVYGPSSFRLTIEDALLVQVLMHKKMWWNVPVLELIDVRELVLGAPSLGGAYSVPPDAAVLKARAKEWKIEAALYVALEVTARLFPETAEAARALAPEVSNQKAELDALLVERIAVPGRTEPIVRSAQLDGLLSA